MSSGGTIINGGCGQLNFTSNQGAFTSPVHQLNQDLSCDYQITVARGTTIKLMFVLMALHEPTYRELDEPGPVHDGRRCRKEYVKLYDGPLETLGDNRNADRICGHQEPEAIHSTSRHYIIQFVRKNSDYSNGFKVQWATVYDPIDFAGCGLRPGFDTPPGDITKRIINGQNADRFSWPSVCRLVICKENLGTPSRWDEDPGTPPRWDEDRKCNLCTGTLVRNLNGNFHVITSASCFLNRHSVYSLEHSYAYCGFHKYRSQHRGHVRFRFISIISHYNYTGKGFGYNSEEGITTGTDIWSDIAVVELAHHTTPPTSIPNRSIQAACLPNVRHFADDKGVGVGWGIRGFNALVLPNDTVDNPHWHVEGGYARKLQQVNVTTVDDDKCSSHPNYRNDSNICVTTMVMSGNRRGQQIGPLCKGDDGGPLLSLRSDKWVVVGVARGQHFYDSCSLWTLFDPRNETDVYVDVFYHRDWINENINYCLNSVRCTKAECVMNIFGDCRSLNVISADLTQTKRARYVLRMCKNAFGNEARLPEADTTSDLDKIYRLSQMVINPVGNMWFGKVSRHRGGSNDTKMWLWPSGNRVDSSLWSPPGQPAFQRGVRHLCTYVDQYDEGLKFRRCGHRGQQSNIVCSGNGIRLLEPLYSD